MGSGIAGWRPLAVLTAAGLAVVICILAGDALHPAPARPSPVTPHRQPPPARTSKDVGSALGSGSPFTNGLWLGTTAGEQSLTSFDQEVGPAILAASYVHWGTPVGHLASLITSATDQHAEAILELEPGPGGHNTDQIASGAGGSDAWLEQVGRMVARSGDPVAVSFYPEMNGTWHAGWSSGPASYIHAYRHVHEVLSSYAGSLITWFWQSSAIHKDTPSPMPWWPGRGYVDVAALDSYYYYPHDTFEAVFGETIRQVRQLSPTVPIMIGETAAGPLFDRQAWEINDLFAGIRRYGLIGLVWFNDYQHRFPYQFHQDWRLQDHSAALAAFRACLTEYGPLATFKTTRRQSPA